MLDTINNPKASSAEISPENSIVASLQSLFSFKNVLYFSVKTHDFSNEVSILSPV